MKKNKSFVVYFKISNEIRLNFFQKRDFLTSLATELSINTPPLGIIA